MDQTISGSDQLIVRSADEHDFMSCAADWLEVLLFADIKNHSSEE
jgi:hypothetical protein